MFHYLCALAPAHVKVRFIKSAVTRAERGADEKWVLSTPAEAYRADFLFLTTGHSKATGPHATRSRARPPSVNRDATVVVDDPYPIKQKLSFITPTHGRGHRGHGLTACDVLTELTVGRGGRFVTSPISGEKQYIPSGQEPRIMAFSRSGLPLTARAVNQKGVSIQYRAQFLLASKIRELRAARKLDFVQDVFPLLLADMQYAYCEAYLRDKRDPVATMLFCNQFVWADAAGREALIGKYVPSQRPVFVGPDGGTGARAQRWPTAGHSRPGSCRTFARISPKPAKATSTAP